MKNNSVLHLSLVCLLLNGCQPKTTYQIPPWVPFDETEELARSQENESSRMRFNLIQSRVLDKNEIWKVVQPQIADFSEEKYQELKPFILEQNIPSIQRNVASGKLTYELLTKWYLYRIVKFENDNTKMLNAIIAINPNAVKQAGKLDQERSESDHPIYGMPILLKDNINTSEMNTTAGAHALLTNETEDAFIVTQIKSKGGIILGKLNLSEWANFICSGCPNGYSAVGGQTLNPYGRMIHDTGGSSAGSGVAMAANYAAAAVGTETSGSILSPSSSNSIVGLKPTIGLLSRAGIVPISSTLDTPGPMTRNLVDNAILLSAMTGEDPKDIKTLGIKAGNYVLNNADNLYGKKFGVMSNWINDTTETSAIYRLTVRKIRSLGGEIYEIAPEGRGLPGFITLLNGDMKVDLPAYFKIHGGEGLPVSSVAEVMEYNLQDTLIRIGYNQRLFEGIVADTTSTDSLMAVKERLKTIGRDYLQKPMDKHGLDAILSINNWTAGYAAVAEFPCLTVPMGYTGDGRPMGITFIGRPFTEEKLLNIGHSFERATRSRKLPEGFE